MSKRYVFQLLIWFLEGILIGFGGIMPGISGGVLCVIFGIYKPLMDVFASPFKNVKKYFSLLAACGAGVFVGFVVLAGFANYLMNRNLNAIICVFVGLILGTMPDLWKDAGSKGRNKISYIAMILSIIIFLGLFSLLKQKGIATMPANQYGFFFCGLMWGLSIVIPGLSSSTLILFFGLYQPMTEGIAKLSLPVIIPLVIGIMLCVLILAKGVNLLYEKFYVTLSHCIIGIVIATMIMILPPLNTDPGTLVMYVIYIVVGAVASYLFSVFCNKVKDSHETE